MFSFMYKGSYFYYLPCFSFGLRAFTFSDRIICGGSRTFFFNLLTAQRETPAAVWSLLGSYLASKWEISLWRTLSVIKRKDTEKEIKTKSMGSEEEQHRDTDHWGIEQGYRFKPRLV
jgi:hypothetical protein